LAHQLHHDKRLASTVKGTGIGYVAKTVSGRSLTWEYVPNCRPVLNSIATKDESEARCVSRLL
ncbi:hypothetical protein CSUI_009785, partial [Cystoisospora suis]